jgi:putative transposase
VREDEVERGQRDGTMREEHAEIVKLRREARRLEEEKLILQKRRISRAGDRSAAMTFQLIDQERAHHAVSRLCSVLNVSRQGYWAWKQHPASRRRLEDERLKRRILAAWTKSDRTYGAPRHAELRLAGGVKVGKKRVARVMRELEIQGVSRRRGRLRTTIPDKRAAPAPDLVNRNFTAARPDETWVADITYVPTHEGWLVPRGGDGPLLAQDRRLEYARRSRSAARRRRDLDGDHSPQAEAGPRPSLDRTVRTLRDSKIMASMGSKGDPWDNACAESCISTIKNELVKRRTFATRDQARLALFRYIESFYNPLRRHSSLEMRSPDEYEHRYWEDNAAAAAA